MYRAESRAKLAKWSDTVGSEAGNWMSGQVVTSNKIT